MAITFPASPVNGQTHTENGQIFVFDSTRGYWLLKKQDQIVASTSRSTFVATAGQTVHNVIYDPSAAVIVSVNGVMLNPQDVTATNGTSITFDTALTLSDEVDIVFHQPTASNLIRQDISDPMATESYVQTYVTNNSSDGVTSYANTAAFSSSGNTVGDFAFAQDTNTLYVWDGSEWDRISSGPQIGPRYTTTPASTLVLNNDGSVNTLTAVAVDESGFPITYDWDAYSGSTVYSASSLPPQLTAVSESSGVFTLTPSTSNSDAGTVTFRTKASDGVLFTPAITTLTLIFGTNITTPSGYPFASSAGTNTFDLPVVHNYPTSNAGFSSTLRTGKIYIELVMGSNTSDRAMIGLCPNEITSAGYETANTFSLYSVFGSKFPGDVDIGLEPFNATGDIVMFAYDTSTREVWAGVNGTWHQDPSTTSSSYTIGTSSTTAFKLMFGANNNSQNYNGTIITGNGTLNYTLPTGFEAH